MVFAVIKRIGCKAGNNDLRLCKMSKRAFLDVGDMVLWQDHFGNHMVGLVMVPDFDGDVAAVLDAWGVSIDTVGNVKALLRRVDILEDGGADEGDTPDGQQEDGV